MFATQGLPSSFYPVLLRKFTYTTPFAGPITDFCQLVRTLETVLEEAVFLGCLPSLVSYNQNSVTLM